MLLLPPQATTAFDLAQFPTEAPLLAEQQEQQTALLSGKTGIGYILHSATRSSVTVPRSPVRWRSRLGFVPVISRISASHPPLLGEPRMRALSEAIFVEDQIAGERYRNLCPDKERAGSAYDRSEKQG